MPRATATRGRRSKPEVQQEFEEIREHAQAAKEATSTKDEDLGKFKEAEVRQAVEGNKRVAAKVLGFDRKTLYRKLERYGAIGKDPER